MRRSALLITLLALPLAGCLTDAQRKKADSSGSLLGIIGPPSPTDAAIMMTNPYDADKRYKGLTWISNAPWGGADVYLRAYRDMVQNDPDMGVRAVAARALAFHGSPPDALLITPLLKYDDKRIRVMAARALQRINNPAVIPDLLPLVDQSKELDKDTRQAVACALGQYPDPRVLTALFVALNDDDLSVARTARQSLRILTGVDKGVEPKDWVTWADATPNPFAGQTTFLYPNYHRTKYFWEYIPFVPPPPNEPSSTPIGYRPPGT